MAAPLAPRFPRWMRGLLLGAIATSISLLAPAQEAAFRRFGLDDGLPQSQVSTLMEDSHGFLWVGTNTNGFARLSAGTFTPYGIAQGVQARSISDLLEDRQGHIWASSYDTGLSEILGNETRNFGPDQGLASSQVYSLALDPEGRVLASTRLGLFRQEPGKGFAPVPLPDGWAGLPVLAVEQDGPDHVWLVATGGRVARWDGHGMEEHPLPKDAQDAFVDFKISPKGTPFALLQDRLLRLKDGVWIPVPLEGVGANPKFRSLTISGGGMQISVAGDGLWCHSPDGSITRLRSSDGLPQESVSAVLVDSRGTLWIGTDGAGLLARVLPQLHTVTRGGAPNEGLGAVMGLLELGKGDFLFAGSTGIYRYKDGQGVVRRWGREDGMASSECWSPLPDGHGGAWIGTVRGLVHWHPDGHLTKGPTELDTTTTVAMARVGDRIYAGTDRGLYVLDAEGRYLAFSQAPKELGLRQVYTVYADGDELLVGLRLGIYTFKNGVWEKRYPSAPFASQDIYAIARDGRHRLWVGSSAGLYEQTDSGWVSRGVQEGLPDDNISFIQPIGLDRVAVGHGKGVSILGPGNEMARLTHSQGLLSDETNHSASLLDSQGRLWIGMIGGLNILDAADSFTSPGIAAPAVSELRWPGGSALYPAQVVLPPHPAALTAFFALPSPVSPDQPRMEALLEGVDSAWRAVETSPVHYLNLAGGNYRFRLRASADGLHWVEAPSVAIEVRLAWYERTWVRALIALLALALLGGVIWWRVRRLARQARRLEAKVQERTSELDRQNRALEQAHAQIKRDMEGRLRLMDMVTHDLRSPLTSLTLSVDRLKEGPEDAEERDMLHGILQRETHRMETMVRQLLDHSRAESLFHAADLKPCVPMDLLKNIDEVLRLKAADKGLAFELESSPDTGGVRVMADPNAMQQVLLNLFENAIKFTPPGGSVGVRSTIERTPGVWRIEVWDTGRGLSKDEAERVLHPFAQAKAEDAARGWGLGLSICLSLLELQKGELRVRSEPGQGATFIISLPLLEA
ncbi:MAG: hypothetical protein JST05_06490 [Acidobacteria bacterium]|nr:hypothetical protein [Acidobacteriota bacterium]